jgi:hypothetical protein
MPHAQRRLGEVVAAPEHVATMKAALEAGWEHVAPRFADASPEVISAARTALADGIIDAFRMGATDLLPLKHSGLTALRRGHPERFHVAAE